jgi:hypothetical protein
MPRLGTLSGIESVLPELHYLSAGLGTLRNSTISLSSLMGGLLANTRRQQSQAAQPQCGLDLRGERFTDMLKVS